MDRLKMLKVLIVVVSCFSLLPFLVSYCYTYLFFVGSSEGFAFALSVALSITFDGIKGLLILSISYLRSHLKKLNAALLIMMLISIIFTINSFVNDFDSDREQTKKITEEYKNKKSDIKDKEEEIKKQELKIEKEKKSRDNSVKTVGKNIITKKIEFAGSYNNIVDKYENELKGFKEELKEIKKRDVVKYEYSKTTKSINTKLLDGFTEDYYLKSSIIAIFFAIMIEISTYFLSKLRLILQEQIYIIQLEIADKNKMLEVEKILTPSIDNDNNDKIAENKNEQNTFKNKGQENNNIINLQKKVSKHDEICKFIICQTIENNNKVPSIKKLVDKSNYSKYEITEKGIKHLESISKLKKSGRFYYLEVRDNAKINRV